jgi:anti-sigma regulatory factor (Ser/Thr protein kinase)
VKSTFIAPKSAKNNYKDNPLAEEFTVDPEVLEHIMGTLTELYSDTTHSVLREYVSNALDSHFKANVNKPVEIFVPSSANKYVLTVRDFGTGMSLDEINTIYRRYGTSTKRLDNGQIGGYGLGGKSALALSDSFNVVSVKDGQKTEFHVEKALSDETEAEIPYLIVDKVSSTSEPNSFTVRIPYGKHAFTPEEVEQFFIGVPKGALSINNKLNEKSVYNEEEFLTVVGADGIPAGWIKKLDRPNYFDNHLKAIVGGIKYDIDLEKMGYDKNNRPHFLKRDVEVYLNVPVGAAKLTPSREHFIYKTQTISTLEFCTRNFVELFEARVLELLATESSPSEVVPLYWRWQQYFKNTLHWRGQNIDIVFDNENNTLPIFRIGAPKKGQTAVTVSKSKPFKISEVIRTTALSQLVVTYSSGELDDADVEAEKLRKRFNSIKRTWGYEEIFLVPEELYNNKWWNFYKAFVPALKTTDDVLDNLKAKAVPSGAKKNETPNVLKSVFPYKVAFFYEEGESDNNYVYGHKNVMTDDPMLNKPIAYLTPDNKGINHPNLDIATQSLKDVTGMWKYIRDNFSEYTIVLLSRRQKVERFTKLYPDSINIYPELVSKIKAEGVPQLSYSWEELKYYFPNRNDVSKLISLSTSYHEKFVRKTHLTSPELDNLYRFTKKTDNKKAPIESLLKNVSSKEFLNTLYAKHVKKYSQLVEKYDMFLHMLNHPKYNDHIESIIREFKIITK